MGTLRLVLVGLILIIAGCQATPTDDVTVTEPTIIEHQCEDEHYVYYVTGVEGFRFSQKAVQELADFLTTMSHVHNLEFVDFVWINEKLGQAMIIMRKPGVQEPEPAEPEAEGEDY